MPLIQRPNAVGLLLCHLVIVEEKTRNVTLANSFQRLEVNEFPSPPIPFAVYTILTDGLGEVTLDLVVSQNDTLDEIYTRSRTMIFKDPLQQLRLSWQVRSCSFPVAGGYQFSLQADGSPITQSTLQVVHTEIDHG